MIFGKRKHTGPTRGWMGECHVSCWHHHDVSAGSVPADVSGVKADVSVDQSTVNVQVSGVHVSVAPPVSHSLEDDMWDPRVKKVNRKEEEVR